MAHHLYDGGTGNHLAGALCRGIAHRLTALSHEQGSTVLADYAWAYDTAGRITSTVNADGTDAFSYDDNGQLTGTDSDYQSDESHSYDDNGNRTDAGYDTGPNNQLLSDGTYDYAYDAEITI